MFLFPLARVRLTQQEILAGAATLFADRLIGVPLCS